MIKLLHVEDNADIREIAKLSLQFSGTFDVVQCASGEEALERVVNWTPDVLLLDLMMPGMSGKQTLLQMRLIEGLRDVPAIFMTARTRETEQEELRAAGAVAVISKPFDPLGLADQIKSIISL
jgi:two-component system phosphate regulon response regulator PhoB